MAKINLFELDIDAEAAIKETARLSDNTEILKSRLDALKKSQTASTEEVVKAKAAYAASNKEQKAAERQLAKLISLEGQQIKTVEQGRVALTVINKEWAKQTQFYGANSKEAENLAKKHLELKNRVNELQKGIGDTSGNIGNYSKDIQEAIGKTTLFGRATGIVNQVLSVGRPVFRAIRQELSFISKNYREATAAGQGFTKGQKASAVATALFNGALRLTKVALIATGVGAFIVLLGSLISFFSKTQRGVDFVNKALAGLGAAFDVVIDRLSQVGGALVKLFSGDFAGAFDDIKNAASGFTNELLREVGAAYQLEEALQNLKDREIDLITVQAARKKRIEELRIASKDEQKDLQERARLLQEANDLEKAILADELKNAKERARISSARLSLGESTRDDIEANAQLQARVLELETESLKKQRSVETEKQGLLKRARAEEAAAAKERLQIARKATDEAIKENKVRLQLFIESSKGEADSLREGLAFAEQVRDRKLAIVQEEAEAGKRTASEAELENLKIKQEFLEKQKELTVFYAEEELQIYLERNRSRLEEGELLTAELAEQEVRRLEGIKAKEAEFQAERLAQGEISQREYNSLLLQIDEEFRDAKLQIEAGLAAVKAEALALDEENRRSLLQERLDFDLALQLEFLEKKKQAEIAAAEAIGADTSLIEAKYADASKAVTQEVNDNKTGLAAQTFGNLAAIFGKESKAGKAAAIAQTTITTYQSAVSAFNSLSGIPIVGPALGAIAAAAAVASGIASVRKITATPTPELKAEQGMRVGTGRKLVGARHSGGGIPLEAEGGEWVLNRRASQLFDRELSLMNAIGNGNSGINSSGFMMDGGRVARSFVPNTQGVNINTKGTEIDYDRLSGAVAQANQSLPAPITRIMDVISGAEKYNSIQQGANI